MKYTFFSICALVSCLALTSCDKEDKEPEVQQNQFVDPVGAKSDAAVLITARSYSTTAVEIPNVPPIEISLDVPVGVFYNGGKQSSAGAVSIDGKTLENLSNTYTLGQSIASPSGEFFMYSGRSWQVAGDGSVPAFSIQHTRNMPTVGTVTAADVVKGEAYTLSTVSVSGADSILFSIGGVAKIVGPNTRSVTFTADETRNVQGGEQTVAQVAAYNIERKQVSGGFEVFLVGEEVRTKFVKSN